jgi:hypothetical protein
MSDELHTLSGAYAVHALPDGDGALFEKHMHECPSCEAEVRRLRDTAARLSLAIAEPPPAWLRTRVLEAVERTPQLTADDSATVWRPRRPPESTAEWEADWVAPEIPTPQEDSVVPLRRWRGRVVAGLAAMSTAAAVALGVVVVDARRDLGDLQARDHDVLTVLAAPDAETVRQPVTAGGSGTVVLSRVQGRMLFTASGLPELPRSRVYELWLMGRDGIRAAGLLVQRPDGMTTPMLTSAARGDEHIGLTIEPAGGSSRPTTPPVMFAELPPT